MYRLRVNPNDHPMLFAGEPTPPVSPPEDNHSAPEPVAALAVGYSQDVLEQLNILSESSTSNRDRRVSEVLRSCLAKGTLLRSDYEARGYSDNMWLADTALAAQLGLITKQPDGDYTINRELQTEFSKLKPHQRKAITAIYEAFGYDTFSSEMFVATLNYSVSYTYASLHKLTLLRILEQKITDEGCQYQLLVNTPDTKKAIKLCFEAHRNQTDKSGLPYVFHPFHVAEQMPDEETTIVALLHDVIEDTAYTIDDLRKMGFSEEVLDALDLMTHDKNVPYMEYVAKISENEIARTVKLADLRHNSDLTRLDEIDDKARNRIEKYKAAIRLLSESKTSFCPYYDKGTDTWRVDFPDRDSEEGDEFTFQFTFIGSSSRNMITYDPTTNVGFDFDVNIAVNDDNEDYLPEDMSSTTA